MTEEVSNIAALVNELELELSILELTTLSSYDFLEICSSSTSSGMLLKYVKFVC